MQEPAKLSCHLEKREDEGIAMHLPSLNNRWHGAAVQIVLCRANFKALFNNWGQVGMKAQYFCLKCCKFGAWLDKGGTGEEERLDISYMLGSRLGARWKSAESRVNE